MNTMLIVLLLLTILIIINSQIRVNKLANTNKELNSQLKELKNTSVINKKIHENLSINNEFISLISHEFRTPLTSILGFTKIIKKKFFRYVEPALEEKEILEKNEKLSYQVELIKNNLDIIISESERLALMIENILDTSKIEFGNKTENVEKLNIETVINKSILSTYSLIGEREIEVLDLVEENIPYIKGNKDQIMQILINLLSNALKFTEKGDILVSARKKDGDYVIIEVKDPGVGIPKKYQEVIFEKFKQVEGKDGDKPKGTGLGLYITKNLVEQHGGVIGVRNNEEKGSCFFFTLPIYKGE